MSKVNIKRLDSVTKNDTTATEQINDNFRALQEAIENTLSRDGTTPNYMDADLDMNSYRIINSADPKEENDIVNLKYVDERIGGAVEASKTATSAATQAANSAQSALVSSTNAINTLRNAEEQLDNVVTYVDEAIQTIDNTIAEAVEDVKQQALDAAQESINTAAAQATAIVVDYANNEIKPELIGYRDSADEDARNASESARIARVWATGEDNEVQEIEEEEHSSRGYADLAMAIANTPEDTPVDASKLLALDVIRGPKGDSGEAEFSGDVHFTGSFNVEGDDNHPVKVTSLAGASASGYQVVDSNGAGESDFEHYASGDRYGTRIANKSAATGKTVNVDLYQTTAGKSVLDLSKPDTILAPQLLDMIYPVGSIYITTNATCPIADLGVGTWELVAEDRVLQGAGTRGAVGTTIEESLPNITGKLSVSGGGCYGLEGAFFSFASDKNNNDKLNWSSGQGNIENVRFSAYNSSSTYQDNAPVQPDAYLVNIFRRIQ